MLNKHTRRNLTALAIGIALVVGACGSTNDASSTTKAPPATASSDSQPATTASPNTSTAVSTTVATSTTAAAPNTNTPADGQFPATIEHAYGSTTIESQPERVLSVGFNEHDFVLALGVVPVGLREWYGEQPNGVWPWAQKLLAGAEPEVLSSGDLNFEQIAALQPDVIVGVWSGMTEEDYALLSKIAPTVSHGPGHDQYGTPWQEQTRMIGAAIGRAGTAEEVVERVEGVIATTAAAHPEWQGKTAAVGFYYEGKPGVYRPTDPRSRLLTDLGFTVPEKFAEVPDGAFSWSTSPEDLSALELDALVWVGTSDMNAKEFDEALPTRKNLQLVKEGREIFTNELLISAFSHSSPLSLVAAVEQLTPQLVAALDGDPSTPVPLSEAFRNGTLNDDQVEVEASTDNSSPDESGDSAGSPEAEAAWELVFDSTADIASKAQVLQEFDALKGTLEKYAKTGKSMGNITADVTGSTVTGEQAAVTFNIEFGGKPAYKDLDGTVVKTDNGWQVPRDAFCALMAQARTPCPSS